MSSDVQFDSDVDAFKIKRPADPGLPGVGFSASAGYEPSDYEKKGMTAWLIRHGMAHSGKSAQGILLLIVAANIILIFIIIKYFI